MPLIAIRLLWAVAIICFVLGILALFGIIAQAASTLLIVAAICAVVAYIFNGRAGTRV